MKYGNYVVLQMRPYDTVLGPFYSVSEETWYGVFEMKPYNKGIGVQDTVEDSYKVDLVASRNSKGIFPSRSWYTCIFSYGLYKEFDSTNNEAFKSVGFCQIQNERLKMLRDIKKNPDKHIWFKDTKGCVHEFFYCPDRNLYYECENGLKVADEDGIVYASDIEMERIMFSIDTEYSEPMKIKYNSFWKYLKHLF